ncbi:hypothetical protein PG994_000018 [Apiospora phragmitis]|uniref:Alpha/beta hydrolase n=1 Tax=Apiospora phragmitis TaxID=2905665 RepID=A0ABR1X519_9PEZI
MFDPPAVGQSSGTTERIPSDSRFIQPTATYGTPAVDELITVYSKGHGPLGFLYGKHGSPDGNSREARASETAGTNWSRPSGPTPRDHFWPSTDPELDRFLALQKSASEQDWQRAYSLVFFRNDAQGEAAAEAYFQRLRESEYNENASDGGRLPASQDVEGFILQLRAIKHWCAPKDKSLDSFYRMHELTMPVLVMTGDDDYVVPTPRSYELLHGLPNCQLFIWPRAGHASIWQYAESNAARVNKFLDSDPENYSEPRL